MSLSSFYDDCLLHAWSYGASLGCRLVLSTWQPAVVNEVLHGWIIHNHSLGENIILIATRLYTEVKCNCAIVADFRNEWSQYAKTWWEGQCSITSLRWNVSFDNMTSLRWLEDMRTSNSINLMLWLLNLIEGCDREVL